MHSQFNHVVVVAGAGSLGLGMVAAARQKATRIMHVVICDMVIMMVLQGPKLLIALDFLDWKLEVAKKCGADLVFNPSKCDVVAEARHLTSVKSDLIKLLESIVDQEAD